MRLKTTIDQVARVFIIRKQEAQMTSAVLVVYEVARQAFAAPVETWHKDQEIKTSG